MGGVLSSANGSKDFEIDEIMREFGDNVFNFDFIHKMLVKAQELITNKNRDMDRLCDLLHKIGRSMFCMRFRYDKSDARHDLCFPGSHDYYVALSRYPEKSLGFYRAWLYAAVIFTESGGEHYPRYLPEIRLCKDDGRPFVTFTDVLITKDDVFGIDSVKDCNMPCYYPLPDGNVTYGTLEQQEKLFRSCLGRNWMECFERYKKHEYPMQREIAEHLEKYRNLHEYLRL